MADRPTAAAANASERGYHLRLVLLQAIVGVLILIALAGVATAATFEPWRGGPAPALALRDLQGREVALEQYRGRTVVVNFWATWCAPCVEELPSLQKLRDRYAVQGLEVITVDYQENAARIAPFLARHGIDLPVLRDHDGDARTRWGVTVFPTSFVIRPDQAIDGRVVGALDWADADIDARLRRLLAR